MTDDLLQRVCIRVQDSMDEILTNFSGEAKITVLVRTPGKPTADFCMTSDDLDEVLAMVHRRKGDAAPAPHKTGDDKPIYQTATHPEWIWYCESTDGVPVTSLGRWPKHPQQRRYKYAEIQETEHDHPAPPAPHLRLNLKPLDWDKQHQTHYANSIFGNYSIWEAGSVFYLRSPCEHAGRVVGTTLEEAKGAALRDIEERILAAIVPAPRQPFAAMTTDYLGCEFMSRDVAQIERIAKGGSKGPTPVTYLFDAPPAPKVTGIRTVAELPMTAFADAAPQRDEFNGEQTILTYSANVGTWDLAFFASGEEFPEKWLGDTHWIDISCMWPGVIAQVASFADAEGSDNDA